MGCDIHAFVEMRSGERWYAVDSAMYTAALPDHWRSICERHPFRTPAELNAGRNYKDFAILFGVRNSANYEPIAAGRGLPEGLDAQWTAPSYEKWKGDAHSESWVTLRELQEADCMDCLMGAGRFMAGLAERQERSPDAVRLVVWFDN